MTVMHAHGERAGDVQGQSRVVTCRICSDRCMGTRHGHQFARRVMEAVVRVRQQGVCCRRSSGGGSGGRGRRRRGRGGDLYPRTGSDNRGTESVQGRPLQAEAGRSKQPQPRGLVRAVQGWGGLPRVAAQGGEAGRRPWSVATERDRHHAGSSGGRAHVRVSDRVRAGVQ